MSVLVKTFGRKSCALCAVKGVEILKITRNEQYLSINFCHEIYGACRHKPRFHRYPNPTSLNKPSTDDPAQAGERVARSNDSQSTPSWDPSFDIPSDGITPTNSTLAPGDSPTASAVGERILSPSPGDTVGEPQFTFEFDMEVATEKLDRL
jgi:hypothetical protein